MTKRGWTSAASFIGSFASLFIPSDVKLLALCLVNLILQENDTDEHFDVGWRGDCGLALDDSHGDRERRSI